MQQVLNRVSRRAVLRGTVVGGLGIIALPLLAACSGAAPASPTAAPAAAAPTQAPAPANAAAPTATAATQAAPAATAAPSGQKVQLHVHMVKKSDVSDWIAAGLKQNIDGFNDKNPNLDVQLDTVPGWTDTYIPKILSMVSAGQIGDAVWYPPRHRSAIAWGVRYNVVRDLNPLAQAANYDMKQFFQGSLDANTWQGKTYWMDYIGEPAVPLIAYNKTKITAMGVQEPNDNWTFDDLVTWAKSLTKGDVFGYYRADAGDGPFGSAPYFRQWGVEFTDQAGKKSTVLDNKDALVSSLKFRQDLINTWKVSPTPSSTLDVTALLGSQKLLAADVWPFRIQGYPTAFKDFQWGFVLTPTVKAGDKRRSLLNEHVFGVTQASKHPENAFSFVTWICGKEMNVQGIIQGAKGSIARQDFWADERIYKDYPAYKKLQGVMNNIEADYFVGNFRGEEFDAAFAQAYDLLELGKAQPEETANQIQKLVQAVLDKDPA
jgi:multiple sugar transport system substrate-binding protein